MKDYKLNISITSNFNNKWISDFNQWIKESTWKLKAFSDNFAKMSADFYSISQASSILKDKLWWLFWNAIDEADKLNNSMVGLKSIVNWTWNDFKKAEKFIQDFTKDWLVTTWEAATSLKNLLSKGYWMDDARQILERLKDSAAFGRAAHLSLWEAVQTATEWIKNENSTLVDNAWVTKNLSVIWDEYAKSIWKTAKSLTDEEKRQATVNWIIQETAFQVWDAAKLTKEYSGQKSKLNATIKNLSATVWSILLPVLSEMMWFVTPLVEWFRKFAEENPGLAKSIVLLAWAFTWLLIVFTSLAAILPFLGSAFTILTWPIGIVIWLIAAFVIAYQTNFLGIYDITNWVLAKISEFFSFFGENLASLEWFFVGLYELFSTSFDNIITFLTGTWNIIEWIFQIAFALISGVFEIFISLFTWNWEGLWIAVINLVTNLWEGIKNIFTWAFQILSALLSEGLEILKAVFSVWWEAIKTVSKLAWDLIIWVLTIAWEAIKTIASWVFEWIKFIIIWIWNGLKTVTSAIWEGLKTWLSNIWNWIYESATNIFTNIKESIISLFKWAIEFVEWAWKNIKSIWNDIKSLGSSIWEKASSAWSWVMEKAWNLANSVAWAFWRAYWWNVSNWKPYFVWERWRELFIPETNWKIIPNNQLWWNNFSISISWNYIWNEADEERLAQKVIEKLNYQLQMSHFGIS